MSSRKKKDRPAAIPAAENIVPKISLAEKYEKILMVMFGLAVFLINLPLAKTEALSPDACGYLSMGFNVLHGRGAVTSYNLYQYWTGVYYPLWPYMQPVYGIIAGILYGLCGLKTAIGFNFFLLGINAVLLYRLARYLMPVSTSFIVAALLAFSANNVHVAVYPWSEELHLTVLLVVMHIFVKGTIRPWAGGALAAVLFFIRSASLYNFAGLFLSLFLLGGIRKTAFKKYMGISAGLLGVILAYEIFCVIAWGQIYPEYIGASQTYTEARMHEGAVYTEGKPVLEMKNIPVARDEQWKNIKTHLKGFYYSFGVLRHLLVIAFLKILYDLLKRKSHPAVIFPAGQGLAVFLGYAFSLSWLSDIETARYSVIPFLLMGLVSLIVLRDMILGVCGFYFSKKLEWIYWIFAAVLFYFVFADYRTIYAYFGKTYIAENAPIDAQRKHMYDWIKSNTGPDTLISSEGIVDAIRAERPFVAFPNDKALNEKNVDAFLAVYKPEYLIIYNTSVCDYLLQKGWSVIIAEANVMLLRPRGEDEKING